MTKNNQFIISDNGTLIRYVGFDSVVVIPNNVKRIGVFSFCDNISIEKVIIPDTVNHISNFAFNGCKHLKEINLPDDVTIGTYAFDDCNFSDKITKNKYIK